jgi:SAM-dependent methyltransferase
MTDQVTVISRDDPSYAGQAVYTPSFLRIYDAYVVRASARFLYRCPSRRIRDLYDRHVSDRHLDVGPGSGYFLDHCRFPSPAPDLTLLDLNPHVLAYSARRLRRYRPRTLQADVLEPLPVEPASFDSIGMNYLLHCVPGSIGGDKAVVLRSLADALAPGGALFGSTVVNGGGDHSRLAQRAMALYRRHGILANADDHLADLDRVLGSTFTSHHVEVQGSVAVFVAHR